MTHYQIKGHATEKLNVIAGLSEGGIVAPMIYECSTDSEIFNFWLEHSLLPEIPKNSLIVLDNASFRKKPTPKGPVLVNPYKGIKYLAP